MIPICSYGCGQPSVFQFKSGKFCCNKSTSKCPAMREKNSASVKEVRNGLGNDYWKNGHPKGMAGKEHPFRNKTYDDIFGVEKAASKKLKMSKASQGNCGWSKISSDEQARLAEEQRQRILKRYEQGWMPKAGRCKKIKYTSAIAGEVMLDGTWELAVAQYMDKQGWKWNRNKIRFPYTNLKGTLSHYTPDFYVEELGGYLEVKGYETELDRCKWKQFSEPLTVWKKDAIMSIMEGGQDGNAADC